MSGLGSGKTVAVFGKMHADAIARLSDAGFTVIERPDHAADCRDIAAKSDAIMVRMTRIDAPMIAGAPKLAIVSRHGVGYDTVDVDALSERQIPLSVVGDVNSGAVAEHTLGLMLALAKRIPVYDRAVRDENFAIRDSFAAIELAERVLLLAGYGRIGRKVARLASAFGMRVLVFDPWADADAIAYEGHTVIGDLAEGLPAADFVSIHVPRTPETLNLIDADALGLMRPTACVINVSRGGLVDEKALAEALFSGSIGGAALDVFEPEPPHPDNPLLKQENVILSPHSAAFTVECGRRMALACANNVIDYFAGRLDPALIVNKANVDDAPTEGTA